jgi:hypothetical protein
LSFIFVIRTFKYNNTLGLCILFAHLLIQITNIGTIHRLQSNRLGRKRAYLFAKLQINIPFHYMPQGKMHFYSIISLNWYKYINFEDNCPSDFIFYTHRTEVNAGVHNCLSDKMDLPRAWTVCQVKKTELPREWTIRQVKKQCFHTRGRFVK